MYLILSPRLQRVASFFSKNSTLLSRTKSKIACGWQAHRKSYTPFASPIGCRSVLCERASPSPPSWNLNSFNVRPVPKCLLHRNFFEEYITPRSDLQVHTISMGFLSTYFKLIKYESDLPIACEHNLVPSETTWVAWLKISAQLQVALVHFYRDRPPRVFDANTSVPSHSPL